VLKRRITSVTAYATLRDAGLTFRKWGEITDYQRRCEHLAYDGDYWKALHKFVAGLVTRKPLESYLDYEGRTPTEDLIHDLAEHAERRREYLGEKREVESLDAQIAELRELGKGESKTLRKVVDNLARVGVS